MEKVKTDLLIIGAGPGGYVAAIYAAKKGLDVVLVDSNRVGGTCLNWGCIPTKSLVKSAELFQEIIHAEHLGIKVGELKLDFAKVIENKDNVKEKLVTGIEYLLNKYGVDVIEGFASFLNDREVLINDDEILIVADNIIIATGSKPKHLNIEGIDLAINSKALLDNKTLPKSMVIIGGGIIGMEFAFIYASFGVKVTVVEFLPNVLPGVDKEFSLRLRRFAKQLDMHIINNAGVTKIEKIDDKLKVFYNHKDNITEIDSDLVLEAVGRLPNIEGLKLENTSIKFDLRNGISADGYMRTNVKNIFAVGDVTNIMQLAHVASHQGICAVDYILGNKRWMDYDAVPAVIFTAPMIATVGKTEEMCKKEDIEYDVVKVPYSANGKALILEGEAGYMKLIRNKANQKLIGGMVFGKDADHLIASMTIAIKNSLSAEDLQETIFAHPTVQELIHEGAMGLDHLAIHFID